MRVLRAGNWQLVCFYYVFTTFTTVGYGISTKLLAPVLLAPEYNQMKRQQRTKTR